MFNKDERCWPAAGRRNQQATLTISVVSHGHGPMLAALLDDLVRSRGPHDAIVVTLNIAENDDFDRTRWQGVEWIDNPAPKGFGANHNAALLGRSSEWYAILNPDIRVGPDVFLALLDRAKVDSSIGLLAPGVVDPDGVPQDSARRLLTPTRLLGRLGSRIVARRVAQAMTTQSELDWLAGMFMLIRRDAFEAVQGFDERFFLYCEDMDVCVRLQLAQYRIDYAHEIEVIHDARRYSHQSMIHLRWHLASLLRAWLKPSFWVYWWQRRRFGLFSDA